MSIYIDAKNLQHYELNLKIKSYVDSESDIVIDNVVGQRYIGDGLKSDLKITINGIPGNDLGAFMDGPSIEVFGNGQDGVGNTMNSGQIIIHGDCGDILGYSMRGGKIYIEGDVGYRAGIHMKSYKDKVPLLIIGGSAGNFLGEYMAGGIIIVLGEIKNKGHLNPRPIVGNYVGTGMHGGVIYIKEDVQDYKIGKEVKKAKIDDNDIGLLRKHVGGFYNSLGLEDKVIIKDSFYKLIPYSHRPYGKLYTY